jgi:hypothetical protein
MSAINNPKIMARTIAAVAQNIAIPKPSRSSDLEFQTEAKSKNGNELSTSAPSGKLAL